MSLIKNKKLQIENKKNRNLKIENPINRKFYIGAIIFLFFGLVFSKLAISLAQFALLGGWITGKNYKEKFNRIKQDIPTIIFLSIFAFFIIGMLWTDNIPSGLKALKIKLPILIIPFIISSSKPITQKELNLLLFAFIFIIFGKTIQNLFVFISNEYIPSIKELSPKISHIRFSLMIDFAVFSLIYLIKRKYIAKKWQKNLSYGLIIWFLFSLLITQSLTGIVILTIVSLILSLIYFIKIKNKFIKYVFLAIVIFLPTILIIYFYNQYKKFYDFKDPDFKELPLYTLNGNKYKHDSLNFYIENGYKVGYFQCEKELMKEWNKIGKIKYNSLDLNGYEIKYTIKRYLTSLGLPKDSLGVSKLTPNDVENIEKSISNYKLTNKISITNRIYKIFWQFHVYSYTKDPNNQSLTQRIEFTKTAFHIIENNFWFGVGTGDIKDAFNMQYETDKSKLNKENRYNTHNQYITLLVLLGVIIGFWCILAMFIPFFMNNKFKEFLPSVFFIIAMLSMLNEDTLRTSIGISFFAIFYSLLILQKQ